jgi:hypothetical protein
MVQTCQKDLSFFGQKVEILSCLFEFLSFVLEVNQKDFSMEGEHLPLFKLVMDYRTLILKVKF